MTKEPHTMKRWIAAAALGLFSFSAFADDPPAADKPAEKTKPAKKAAKKKADPKKDDGAAKP
jgi:hypothetical protein